MREKQKTESKKKKIEDLLSRNVEEVYEREHLMGALLEGKKLRIKHGIDPTGPKIHLGRAIPLWKLKAFQELGHQVVLVIGDFTAQIGDASDKQTARKPLSLSEVKTNMKGYERQIGKILSLSATEIRYNSEWLGKMNIKEFLKLAAHFTSQQLIQRRNFKERWERGNPIGLQEILYPIFQGFDSVAVKADVELGGSDQLFNLQIGREIQKIMGQQPQDILTLKMLLGTDGRKMSTSWGNTIAIEDSPQEQFGKIMSLRDELIFDYFELATNMSLSEIEARKLAFEQGRCHPRDLKIELAQKIVELYHGAAEAENAKQEFERVFQKKGIPSRIPHLSLSNRRMVPIELLVTARLASSKSEAKRLLLQKGVKINGKTIENWREPLLLQKGMVIQVGKRRFLKIE